METMHRHIALGGILTPFKLSLQPRQSITVTGNLFRLSQSPPDLGNVTDDSPGEAANLFCVFIKS
jgi:hypothetical protein